MNNGVILRGSCCCKPLTALGFTVTSAAGQAGVDGLLGDVRVDAAWVVVTGTVSRVGLRFGKS